MTITKGVWYKKHVEASFIQWHLFPFLFFPSSNRGVQQNRDSAQRLLTAKAVSATNTLPPPCFPSMSRQGVGWSRVRGWRAEGGSCQSGKKEGKHLFRGQMRWARSAAETQPFCSSYAITSKVCTAQRVPQPACTGWTGGSRAAGRRSIMILIALPRC